MSNVTLSVVVPSIDIIFDDDTAAILTAVDADTVLGVTPGVVGLQILAASTADAALALTGGVGPVQAESFANSAVSAHSMSTDPHRVYFRNDAIANIAGLPDASRQAVSAHSMAVNPHPQYPTVDQMMIADADSVGLTMAHISSRAAHPDRPTFDQSILFASFFGN